MTDQPIDHSMEIYDRICKQEFLDINTKLDRIDLTLRGNGVPGHGTRLDRLEQEKKSRQKVMWTITVAIIGLFVMEAWKFITG